MERNEARLDLVRSSGAWVSSAAPDGESAWRLPPRGGIERSTDGGRTWRVQQVAPATGLLALRAVDANTCWAAGRGGSVLRTTDGERWSQVPFPATADLVAIDAAGVLAATVTTIDGRTFATADGGRTWRSQ